MDTKTNNKIRFELLLLQTIKSFIHLVPVKQAKSKNYGLPNSYSFSLPKIAPNKHEQHIMTS